MPASKRSGDSVHSVYTLNEQIRNVNLSNKVLTENELSTIYANIKKIENNLENTANSVRNRVQRTESGRASSEPRRKSARISRPVVDADHQAYQELLAINTIENYISEVFDRFRLSIEIKKICDDISYTHTKDNKISKIYQAITELIKYHINDTTSKEDDVSTFIATINSEIGSINGNSRKGIDFKDFINDSGFMLIIKAPKNQYVKIKIALNKEVDRITGDEKIYYESLKSAKRKAYTDFDIGGKIYNLIERSKSENPRIRVNDKLIHNTLRKIRNLIEFCDVHDLEVRAILLNLGEGQQLDHDLLSVAGFVSYLKKMEEEGDSSLDENSRFFRFLYQNFNEKCTIGGKGGSPESPTECRKKFDKALPRTAVQIDKHFYGTDRYYTHLINAYGALVHGIISYAKVKSNVNRSLGNPGTDFNSDTDLYNYLVDAHNGGVLLELRKLLREQGFRELVYTKGGGHKSLIEYNPNGTYTSKLLDYFTKPDTPPPEKNFGKTTWRAEFVSVKKRLNGLTQQ